MAVGRCGLGPGAGAAHLTALRSSAGGRTPQAPRLPGAWLPSVLHREGLDRGGGGWVGKDRGPLDVQKVVLGGTSGCFQQSHVSALYDLF